MGVETIDLHDTLCVHKSERVAYNACFYVIPLLLTNIGTIKILKVLFFFLKDRRFAVLLKAHERQ